MSLERSSTAASDALDAGGLRALGLEAGEARGILGTVTFEEPAFLFDLRRVKNATLGAFTYVNGAYTTSLYDCRIGRYCSIAEAVVLGPYEHPTEGLTTHPFAFAGPDEFPAFFRMPAYARLAVEHSQPVEINRRHTEVGHDVWIGAGAFIKRGVKIGDGAVIAAHALVTRDVPPYTIVAGTPARVVRLRFPEAIVGRLQALAWWNYDLAPHKQDLDLTRVEPALERLEQLAKDAKLQPLNPAAWQLTKIKGLTRFRAERLPEPLF